jgi:hypothetical protein
MRVQLARIGAGQRAVAVIAVAAITVAGCGSSGKSTTSTSATAQAASAATTLALSISEAGRTPKFVGPASVRGGLVTVQLTNDTRATHGAQLIRIEGTHTIEQALKTLGGESRKTPSWLRAEGGVGAAASGSTASATVSLPAGSYAIVDVAGAESGQGGGGGPAFAPLTVTPGKAGALPSTATTITAANPSKDHYKWQISGPLKVGANAITFASKGSSAIHELTAVRITGNESTAQLVKALESNGPPPSFVDVTSKQQTAVLDGGKSLTTQLTLSRPGKYVFFCHLTDRDGGKPHFAEGLITTVTVQ